MDGEGNYAAIDPVAVTNWYATSEFGVSINRCPEGAGCDIAGFGQPVIGSTQVGGDGGQQTIPASWILDPQDSAKVILGTCRVWRGPGIGGSSWSSSNLLSPMLDGIQGSVCNGNAEIRSLAASGSATDAAGAPERIYAGMAGLLDGGSTVPGHVFTASVTSSSGQSTVWTDLFHSPVANGVSAAGVFNPGGFDISSIYVDPHDPSGQTIYATVQGFTGNQIAAAKVYGSTNGGATWSNLSTNLPNAPANSVVVDPNDANTVYVALDTGVYVTTNVASCATPIANCWSVFGTSLPSAPVVQLVAFNAGSTSVLRAATYGRGVWQIGLVTSGTVRTMANAAPPSLTFPAQQVQTQSATQTVVVTNTGNITLNTNKVTITGDFAETDSCGQPVAPGDACTIQVTFTPSQTGQRTGELTVYGNISGGSTSGQLGVALSGAGVPGPAIVLTPSQMSFPETLLGKTAPSQDVTISNTGGVLASLASETVTGDFSIAANTCTGSLAANSGCTLTISFSPTASGSRAGVLTVVDSAGTQTAQLSGTGESQATDGLAPLNLTFAAQVVDNSSLAQRVTLTNNGDEALQLIATQVSGDFNAVNGCGTTLVGHASCAIAVNYVPTQLGAATGTLIVSDALRSQTVTLAGTGLAPAGISATPTSINFGNYAVGKTSPPQTVTVTNNGGVALNGLSVSVTGSFAIQTVANACGATLGVGAACQVGVVFTPPEAGALSGGVTVTAANLSAPLKVALTGSGEDFTLQVNGSSSAVLTSGQSATFQLQVAPVSGSIGTVALACTGAPQNATCTINPASLTLTGSNTAGATVTIATGQSGSSASVHPFARFRLALAMAVPVGFLARRRRTNLRLLGFLAIFLMGYSLGLVGCGLGVKPGSGSSSPTPPPNSTHPTPPGIYTLTLTGTAPGLSHTAQLTLTVE